MPKHCGLATTPKVAMRDRNSHNQKGAPYSRYPKNSRAAAEGRIAKSMYFDSSTVEVVDHPPMYRMLVRRAPIA